MPTRVIMRLRAAVPQGAGVHGECAAGGGRADRREGGAGRDRGVGGQTAVWEKVRVVRQGVRVSLDP